MRQATLAIKLETFLRDARLGKASAQSTFLQLTRWSKFLLPFSWFHDSVIPFSINIFLFRKKVSDSNCIMLRKRSVDRPKRVHKSFFLDGCKHILFLCICLQDCESEWQNFLPSFYNGCFGLVWLLGWAAVCRPNESLVPRRGHFPVPQSVVRGWCCVTWSPQPRPASCPPSLTLSELTVHTRLNQRGLCRSIERCYVRD